MKSIIEEIKQLNKRELLTFDDNINLLCKLMQLKDAANNEYNNLLELLQPELKKIVYNGTPLKIGTEFEFIRNKEDKIFLRKSVK